MSRTKISQATNIYERLRFPFPEESVKWRIGARNRDKTRGSALAYIDARDVMDRLDRTVGFQNWQTEYGESAGSITICSLSIRIDGEWIKKSDGAGKSQIEGEKGASSDSYKRSAVQFGVGRYLYSLPDTWVDLVDEGTKFANPNDLNLPEWATPVGWKKIVLKMPDKTRILTNKELADLNELVDFNVQTKGKAAVESLFNDMNIDASTVWTDGLMEPFVARLSNLVRAA